MPKEARSICDRYDLIVLPDDHVRGAERRR